MPVLPISFKIKLKQCSNEEKDILYIIVDVHRTYEGYAQRHRLVTHDAILASFSSNRHFIDRQV